MGLRFWKRIKLLPGVTLNLSKSGPSLSVGPQGAKVTVGARGAHASLGLPGTGLFYTTKLSKQGKSKDSNKQDLRPPAPPPPPSPPPPPLGPEEQALVAGQRALEQGDPGEARRHFERASASLPDAAFLGGYLALDEGQLEEAEALLARAVASSDRLGQQLLAQGLPTAMVLPVTEEVSAVVEAGLRGALLGLVEVYQRQGRFDEALLTLERLITLTPEDAIVKLSLVELLLETRGGEREAWHRVVKVAAGIKNESTIHAAILLYKARALRELGMLDAAKEVLTTSLKRTKARPAELLLALRYERAQVFEALGEKKKARAELERIFAEAPDFADVSQRLTS